MKEYVRSIIGNPLRLPENLPALARTLRDPRFEVAKGFRDAGTAIFSIPKLLSNEKNGTVVERNVKIPMRDGTRLCADLFRHLFNSPGQQFADTFFIDYHFNEL